MRGLSGLPEFPQMWVGHHGNVKNLGARPSSEQSFLSLGQSRLAACWTLLDGVMMPKKAFALLRSCTRWVETIYFGPSPDADGRLDRTSM